MQKQTKGLAEIFYKDIPNARTGQQFRNDSHSSGYRKYWAIPRLVQHMQKSARSSHSTQDPATFLAGPLVRNKLKRKQAICTTKKSSTSSTSLVNEMGNKTFTAHFHVTVCHRTPPRPAPPPHQKKKVCCTLTTACRHLKTITSSTDAFCLSYHPHTCDSL